MPSKIKIKSNPLAPYFRVPGVHIKLPTNGAFLPEGSVEFTMKGEVPVFPMRSADELLLKSPDALMNGYAIEKLLESCVPAISNVRQISSPDLDAILLAIRAATYGETIELLPVCPACQTTNEVRRNLSYLITNMQFVDPENQVRLTDEVIAYVKPYTMHNATTLGMATFEETRLVQALEGDTNEVKAAQMNKSMQRLADLMTEVMANCIIKIVIPNDEVTDTDMILQFIQNVSKEWTDKIQFTLDAINKKGIDKGFEITCAECGHEWKSQIEFDPTTFFAHGSSR
jgi:hypothetical protein